MKLIVAAIFAWTTLFGAPPASKAVASSFNPDLVLLNPAGTSIGEFLLSYKDYQDLRIDVDKNGSVDMWVLRKGALEIRLRYLGDQVSYIHFIKRKDGHVAEALYRPLGNKFTLVKAVQRKARVINGDSSAVCAADRVKVVNEEIKKFSESLSLEVKDPNIESYLSDTCFESENTNTLPMLKDVLADNNDLKFADCIASEKLNKAAQASNFQVDETSFSLYSAQLKLDLLKLVNEKAKEPLFICEDIKSPDAGDKSKPMPVKGSYTEGKDIKISMPSSGVSSSDLRRVVLHELVHRAGLQDDKLTEFVLDQCLGSGFKTETVSKNDQKSSVALTVKDALNVSVKEGGKAPIKTGEIGRKPANIVATPMNGSLALPDDVAATFNELGNEPVKAPSEIASAQPVATGKQLAATKVDKSPEGLTAAVKDSATASAPVFRMANEVMGAVSTPALADTTPSSSGTYASSGASGGGSSAVAASDVASGSASVSPSTASAKSVAEYTKYREQDGVKSSSRSPASTSVVASDKAPDIGVKSRNTLKSDERIVEQIDLNGSYVMNGSSGANSTSASAASDTAAFAKPDSSRTAKSAASSRGSGSSGAGASYSGRAGGSAASLGGGGASGSNVAGGGSASALAADDDLTIKPGSANKTTSPSRAPAAIDAATAKPQTGNSSREEVVTFFARGDYSTTKSKLKDSNFVNSLKTNKVTIIDLYGNSYGADRGDVVFLDEGNRFVRQK